VSSRSDLALELAGALRVAVAGGDIDVSGSPYVERLLAELRDLE
jgi:hypothetical protein